MWTNRLLVVLGLLACLLLLHHRVHGAVTDPNRPIVKVYRYHHVNIHHLMFHQPRTTTEAPIGHVELCGNGENTVPYAYFMRDDKSEWRYFKMACHMRGLPESGTVNDDADQGNGMTYEVLNQCTETTGLFIDCYKTQFVIDYFAIPSNLAPLLQYSNPINAYEILKDACKNDLEAIINRHSLQRTKFTIFSLVDLNVRQHFGFDKFDANYDKYAPWLNFNYFNNGKHNVKFTVGDRHIIYYYNFLPDKLDSTDQIQGRGCHLEFSSRTYEDCLGAAKDFPLTAHFTRNEDDTKCYPLLDTVIITGFGINNTDAPWDLPPEEAATATAAQKATASPPSQSGQLVPQSQNSAVTGAQGVGAVGSPAGSIASGGAAAGDPGAGAVGSTASSGVAGGGSAVGSPVGGGGSAAQPTAQPAATDSSPSAFLHLAA